MANEKTNQISTLDKNMNGNARNQHHNGSITLEGVAMEWIRQREQGLARMTHQELEQYNTAMDRLYLNSERVRIKPINHLQLLQNPFLAMESLSTMDSRPRE